MNASRRASIWIPAGLIVLSLVPAIAGAARLRQVAGGIATDDNARFLAMPVPVAVHIAGALVFSLLGAFQFVPELRRRRSRWHRVAGWVLVPCGLAVSLSGLWMTLFYPTAGLDGPAVYGMRLVVGALMTVSLWLAVSAVRRRAIADHRAWMTRAYGLGMGAGTQVLTHLPLMLFPSLQSELSRAIAMGAAWVINAVVAELAIRRSSPRGSSAPRAAYPLARSGEPSDGAEAGLLGQRVARTPTRPPGP